MPVVNSSGRGGCWCLPESERHVILRRMHPFKWHSSWAAAIFPYFTNLAFGLYYHKIPNDGSPFVLNFTMYYCSFHFLEKEYYCAIIRKKQTWYINCWALSR